MTTNDALYSDEFYEFNPTVLESGRTRTFYIRNRGRIS